MAIQKSCQRNDIQIQIIKRIDKCMCISLFPINTYILWSCWQHCPQTKQLSSVSEIEWTLFMKRPVSQEFLSTYLRAKFHFAFTDIDA